MNMSINVKLSKIIMKNHLKVAEYDTTNIYTNYYFSHCFVLNDSVQVDCMCVCK